MARLTASLSIALRRAPFMSRGARPVVSRELRTRPIDAGTAAHPEEASPGPGWFNSSFDLQRGLDVREGLPGDAALHEWLTVFCLAGQGDDSGHAPVAAARSQPVRGGGAAPFSSSAM